MPESAEPSPVRRYRETFVLLAAWLLLAAIVVLFATQNLAVPGLYYDEAIFAGLAKDFVTGHAQGQHMPGYETVTLAGHPFPVLVQDYLGALKSWMLIPAFQFFGTTFAVLRGSNLFWQLTALLLLMLGARRWFGCGTAVIAGAFLAFDPTYFFISVLDWGVALPSFVCRCACFLFAVRWNQMRKLPDAFLAGLFAGLGFFNKGDFAIFLLGIAAAAVIFYWKELIGVIRQHSGSVALAAFGFAIGAGPMLIQVPRLVTLTVSAPHPNASGQLGVKIKTLLSMYDGTHVFRLMNVGGVFERMYDGATGPRTIFGIALVIALLSFAFVFDKVPTKSRRITFLVAAWALITVGVFLLPDAVRIHHEAMVYPLPHLILAALVVMLWKTRTNRAKLDYAISALIAVGVVDLVGSQIHTIQSTEQLIQKTGGRGRWSESLNQFCHDVSFRSALTIVSLDWGFNEQLMFLTDGPQLSEPFWQFNEKLPPLPTNSDYIFLAHPAEYSVLKYDVAYLDQLQKSGANVEVTPHFDRENEIAFYTIRFRSP